MIVKDMTPPSIVEDDGFIEFVGMCTCMLLNLHFTITVYFRYKPPSRRTIIRFVNPKKYSEEKERLMKQLEAIDTCALTTDFWSSADTHSYYITVTCHFTDALWELHSCVLVTY